MTEITNYNFCLEVVELKKNIEVAYLLLGEKLGAIRDRQLYSPNWESFEDYLDEIKINVSVASRLITVYNKFVVEYGLDTRLIAGAGGWSNAYEISRLASGKEEAQRMLEESSLMTPKDVKIRLREQKTGIMQDSCDHADTYTITVCRKCGIKIKQNEDTEQKNGFDKVSPMV